MNLEENISFIQAQTKMMDVYVEGVKYKIQEKEKKQVAVKNKLSELRQEIRLLKKELIADDRLPSELEIEKKLNIKKRIEFYAKFQEDFTELVDRILHLSKDYEKMLIDREDLPKEYFSSKDREKLSELTGEFRRILNKRLIIRANLLNI